MPKDNTGYVFDNRDNPKAKSPYGGSATVDGIEYWINAWKNDGEGGKKPHYKLSFVPKQPKDEPRQKSWSKELDDDIF